MCVALGVLYVVFAGLPFAGAEPPGPPRPNIIFVLIDSLRADRLGIHGHPDKLTPTMDALAAEGVAFDYCVSPAPWTAPSIASLFVAYYPSVHKATRYIVVGRGSRKDMDATQSVLSDSFDTLAEILKANGYQTAAFSSNRLIRPRFGFAQGFDHFDEIGMQNTVPGTRVNAAAIRWLDHHRDPNKPMFMYVHYMDVHGPYNALPQFMDPLTTRVENDPQKRPLTKAEWDALGRYLKQRPPRASDVSRYARLKGYRDYWVARYDAGVAECDFHLGQFFDALRERGLWDDTYIIVTADHGESLCEHGIWDHGQSQYQAELHIPLIMRWPGALPQGMRVQRLAGLIDFMPTLVAQLEIPSDGRWQGASLVPHLDGTLPDTPIIRMAEADKAAAQRALFRDNMKLIEGALPPRFRVAGTDSASGKTRQLFDLASDPGETRDLAGERPSVADDIARALAGLVASAQHVRPDITASEAPVEQEMIDKLRALGYLGEQYENQKQADSQAATRPASRPTPP